MKEKNPYPSFKIYEGVCSCKENYTGETKRNVITCWNEHENPNKDSEPAKNLFQHPDHVLQWKVLMSVPMNNRKTKNLDALKEFALVRRITQVKPNEMLLLVGMSMKIQTKIQNQPRIFFNTLIMFYNGKF